MKRSHISTRASFAAILLLFGLASCDSFLVARCEFEKRECPPPLDAGSKMQDSDMSSPAATGPERAFEWRAKVPLDAKTKFVGLYGNSDAIFLQNVSMTPTPNWLWSRLSLQLGSISSQYRLIVQTCTTCPSLTSNDLTNIDVYLAGDVYYALNRQSKTVIRITPPSTIETLSNISTVFPAPRPFAHPNLDALIIAALPLSSYTSSTAIVLPGDAGWVTAQSGSIPTSFLLGDLDAKYVQNGYEAILFSGSKVKIVQHQKPALPDTDLQNAMQIAIDSKNGGNETSINAGFIANINNDDFIDLIFATPTKVFASSYMGRMPLQPHLFANWKDPLISVSGEIVHSVVAADLTADGYPELVIETDQAVHFYLSIPKPQ